MYFTTSGRDATRVTIDHALARARALHIRDIVCASTTGYTARLLAGHRGFAVVCVRHQAGFAAPGRNEMSEPVRRRLESAGVPILTTTHLFRGVDRCLSASAGGSYPPEIIANTLRIFGQGMKVAVEVAVMALDAGLIPAGRDVIAIGGTHRGADTALVVRPAHAHRFFDTVVREVICKPRA